jgi:hypothetical protein
MAFQPETVANQVKSILCVQLGDHAQLIALWALEVLGLHERLDHVTPLYLEVCSTNSSSVHILSETPAHLDNPP